MEPNFLITYLESIENISVEDRQAALSLFLEDMSALDKAPILSVNGDTAEISIEGVLTMKGPSIIDRLFGYTGTSYEELLLSLKTVSENPNIKNLILKINSPGGEANGVDAIYSALTELKHKCNIVAENHGLMASAAYWIASACNEIVALSPGAETGSVGVVISALDTTKMLDKFGVKKYTIVSKNAPNKAPDIATEDGRNILQERVDALENVFMARVASGRGLTLDHVQQNFGRGIVMIAEDPTGKNDALKCGMIDSVRHGMGGSGSDLDAKSHTPEAATSSFKDYDIVDIKWDGPAADKRIREKIGAKDKPNDAYADNHFWYDAANKDKFESYKLNFTDVVDGKIVAIRKGIFSADGAMHGARGTGVDIPDSDRGAVQAHIDKYKAKIEEIDDKSKSNGGKTQMDALNTLLSEDAGAKALYDIKLKEQFEAGKAAAQAEIKTRIDKASVFMSSDAYPAAIKTLANEVLTGAKDMSVLDGAVAFFDMQKERASENAATSNVQPDTKGGSSVPSIAEGYISTNADIEAAAKKYIR